MSGVEIVARVTICVGSGAEAVSHAPGATFAVDADEAGRLVALGFADLAEVADDEPEAPTAGRRRAAK